MTMDTPQKDRLATEQTPTVGMRTLLEAMIAEGASDLHISVNERPKLRIDGRMITLLGEKRLRPKDTQELAYSVLTEQQKKRFEQDAELDFSFAVPKLSRFRGNVFRQRGSVAMAIRMIPFAIRSFEELGLPPVVAKLAEKPRGLVLVTGPTGSGKSTTLASMIDMINSEREGHIITIEDPIEFVHTHKKCLVNQREVGADTESFPRALKYVLRQDPDVILIGEMRDLETIAAALTIAETGHRRVGKPDHRCLSGAPAGADSRPARLRAGGRGHSGTAADVERHGPRPGAGDHAGNPGDSSFDPRRQDPPDLLGSTARQEAWYADDERLALPALHEG